MKDSANILQKNLSCVNQAFQKTNNIKDTVLAIIAQYAGEDKWENVLKYSAEILQNRCWSVQGTLTLDKFILVHCNSYVLTTQCSEDVDYQLPNKLTCVIFLLDYIEYKDTGLNEAIAMVKENKGQTGKINKYEDAAAYLTPWEHVAKNHNTNRKRGAAEISNTSSGGAQVTETGAK